MSSVISAIANDIELYKELCLHYGEKFVESGVYTDHYVFLKSTYRDDIEPHSKAFADRPKSWAQTAE